MKHVYVIRAFDRGGYHILAHLLAEGRYRPAAVVPPRPFKAVR